jgi:hypothetical protein
MADVKKNIQRHGGMSKENIQRHGGISTTYSGMAACQEHTAAWQHVKNTGVARIVE